MVALDTPSSLPLPPTRPLLRKFISDRGKIRSRRITGVTVQEQRELSKAIKNAREMALLPYATSGR